MVLETRVRDPSDVLVLLEPACKSQSVGGMALSAQTQRLDTQQELLRSEGVQSRSQITQDFDAHADREGDGSEGLPEFEAVVALGRFDELGESSGVLAPVEFTAVDDDAGNGGAVAADPFGCAVDDDIGAVIDGTGEVAACSEGVVDLFVLVIRMSLYLVLEMNE